MLKHFFILFLLFVLAPFSYAHEGDIHEEFYRGEVIELGELETLNRFGFEEGEQSLKIQFKDGAEINEIETTQQINLENPSDSVSLQEGDEVILVETHFEGESDIQVYELYRGSRMLWLLFFFLTVVFLVTGKKGFRSVFALTLTLFLLVYLMIPAILFGYSPLLVGFLGSLFIMFITLYLSHGFNKKTTLALGATFFTLILAAFFSVIAVYVVRLTGSGTEDAMSLSFGAVRNIDLKGLLLAGFIIGTLGILDDITVTQISTVHQIHQANKKLGLKELYQRGLEVGKDHIASVINTLFLAYAGVSFPLLIMLVYWPRPTWVTLNNEFMAEEIVRTLVGSTTLVLAVPVATLLAAWVYGKK